MEEGLVPLTLFVYSLFILSSIFEFSSADNDLINSTQSIADGETLVSSGTSFELGFFSPSGSTNRYLGIWYRSFPQIIVWVANRGRPLTDLGGVLIFSSDGNLILLNATKSIIWSSNSSRAIQNSFARLLDSGNLVLGGSSDLNAENSIWQSFDYPSDTLLPGMKLGWNFVSKQNPSLTSWKSPSDPAIGDFTYRLENLGLPQAVLRKGSEKRFRTGPWNGLRFSGVSTLGQVSITNSDELLYMPVSVSYISRIVQTQSGIIEHYVLREGSSEWVVIYRTPSNMCDNYGQCGPNGICRMEGSPTCECLKGFVPKKQSEWDVLIRSSGCVRSTPLNCQNGDGFVELKNVKSPDLLEFLLNKSMNLEECKAECLKNCSCMAFANSDIMDGGSGCLMWFDDLIDIREFSDENSKQNMYIRMPASLLDHKETKKRRVLIIAIISTVLGVLFLCFLRCSRIWWRKKKQEANKEDIELPLFHLHIITTATNDFSSTNMVGKGGFGSVYKGKLSSGQEIAVKRLSKNSGQGIDEFKNEIILISKLQHRNLVKLLGCCLSGEERMLVYEYMPNKSLDHLIFDQNSKVLLTWHKRFEISLGIAKGLLYLHHDSRLRIIHRDLKASNVLLDSQLNPKISDFGIARIFVGDQIEAKTKHVIGTYGYMSPEYAIDGKFSVKSDVFSFGVLMIEIVSGKKNNRYHHPVHYRNLLGHAWMLWNEGKALELVDPCLEDLYIESQVLRCIQIGLLCVQKFPKDRPTMAAVVSMLGNEGVKLGEPKEPGFFMERDSEEMDTISVEKTSHSENAITITLPEAR
ncbi:hypothetical protein LguiB_002989 [Lonicera macranthoides]